jgi:hypothetical protein
MTISIPPRQPVTVITAKLPRYHFARLVTAAGISFVLEMRKPFARLGDLAVIGLILDTFVEIDDGAMAMISIQFDVRLIAAHGDRILRLQAIESQSLQFTMPRRRR